MGTGKKRLTIDGGHGKKLLKIIIKRDNMVKMPEFLNYHFLYVHVHFSSFLLITVFTGGSGWERDYPLHCIKLSCSGEENHEVLAISLRTT